MKSMVQVYIASVMLVTFGLPGLASADAALANCQNHPENDQASNDQYSALLWFGECYYSFNCAGTPIGEFSDQQCKSMGGHSMDVGGGSCIPLN